MRKGFFPRFAMQSIKKNGKFYLPYILTSVMSVALFYILLSIIFSKSVSKINGGSQLQMLLSFCAVVAAIFFAIFLFYTNSFLIKRRKKEFGLYCVLGMEKRHIAAVNFFETLYVSAISIVGGLLSGALFSKLIFLLLLQMAHFDVTLSFDFSPKAAVITAVFFLFVFVLLFISTVLRSRVKIVDLLRGGNTGEREPRIKWVLAVIGVLTLGWGYYIALTTQSPLAAFPLFMFAAILVMIGTYCLFIAGSIAVLKGLRRNKKYYYKTKHFISVSGMIYRMKQNAAGLASICVLCTAVLVMLSTSASLYGGMDSLLDSRYPRIMYVSGQVASAELTAALETEIEKSGAKPYNVLTSRHIRIPAVQNGNSFLRDPGTLADFDSAVFIYFGTVSDYNAATGKDEQLAKDEVLAAACRGSLEGRFSFEGLELNCRPCSWAAAEGQNHMTYNSYYIFAADDATAMEMAKAFGSERDGFTYEMYFDTDLNAEKQMELYRTLDSTVKQHGGGYAECREEGKESFFGIYGGLLFIGVFLGLVFMIATVLIIYYKQVSEGYDDKRRFEIMQQVGLDRAEAKKVISHQVLTVFFLPLLTSFIHLAVAFPLMTQLLQLLNLTDVSIFVIGLLITSAVFALAYALVYWLTSKVYYKIVS